MGAREKIAYLKGLADGQHIADTPDKQKFYEALIDAMDSLAKEIQDHDEVHEELNDYLEQLEEDVSGLEEDVDSILGYDDDDDDDDDEEYDDDDDECCCGHHHHHHHHDEDDDEEDGEELGEEEYASVTCPNCGKDFYYEPSAYAEDEDLLCPHCGKPFKQPEEEQED